MAVGTRFPFSFMGAAVDGEIPSIMVEFRALPGGDVVTGLTFFGEA